MIFVNSVQNTNNSRTFEVINSKVNSKVNKVLNGRFTLIYFPKMMSTYFHKKLQVIKTSANK